MNPGPAIYTPAPIQFPPTWTPVPTATPEPPRPTATLVIQSATGDSTAVLGNIRRFPFPAHNSIGLWVDTTYVSNPVLQQLASRVQLASGPQASALRQINSRIISLERLNSGQQSENPSPVTRPLDSAYDGRLLEQVGAGANTDPYGVSDRLLTSARDALDTRLLVADTYAWKDGAAFQEHSTDVSSLLGRVDGACLCNFLRVPEAPLSAYKSESDWREDVDALAAVTSHPNLIVLVATRFNSVTDQELDQLQSWFDYALGSFLMGENGSYAYFSFQGPHADDYMARSELDNSLGYPIAGYYTSFGMYARHFQHGLVIVNAGESLREMPLARMYVTSSGEQVTSIRLEPHTGEILLIAP